MTVSGNKAAPPLNDVQLMLLRLFSRPMREQDLQNIRKFLLDYYDAMLQNEIEVMIQEKGIKRKDFENLLEQDIRSK